MCWSFPSGRCGFMGFLEELWHGRFTFTTTTRNAKMRLGMFGVQSSYNTAISYLVQNLCLVHWDHHEWALQNITRNAFKQKQEKKTLSSGKLWATFLPPIGEAPCCPRLPLFFVDLLPTRSRPVSSPASQDSISSNNPPWWYWKNWEVVLECIPIPSWWKVKIVIRGSLLYMVRWLQYPLGLESGTQTFCFELWQVR